MTHRLSLLGTTALAAAVAFSAGSASAQGLALEEIVVTARKTEERLQDVPLAITAFSAEQIEAAAIENLDDVAAFTPGLTFSNLFGEFLPTPVIRGVAPTDIFGENNAAVFVDGVFVSGREGLNFSQLDIERIEVVKGPQSALYGRSAFSGAINIVTARPTDELEGKVELTLGNDGRHKVMGRVGGPIVEDKVGARLAVIYDEFGGSYENQNSTGPDIGGYAYTTLLGSLLFTPSEDLEIATSFYVSEDEISAPAMTGLLANCEDNGTGQRLQNYCGVLPSAKKKDLSVIDGAVGEDRSVVRADLRINWDFEGGTLSTLTGYSDTKQSFFEDGSRGFGPGGQVFAYRSTSGSLNAYNVSLLQKGLPTTTEEFSQEIRYTSPMENTVRGSFGGYYYTVDQYEGPSGVIALEGLPADFRGFPPEIPVSPFFTVFVGNSAFMSWFTEPNGSVDADAFITNDTEAFAGFGYLEGDVTEQLTLRAEVRYSDEEKKFYENVTGAALENSWDFWTMRFSADYKPNDDWLIYASAAKGSKSGGFTTADTAAGDIIVKAFEPESNWSYELGVKGTGLDGRLQTDIAVFYIDWSDIVIPQIDESLGEPLSFSQNAGKAEVKGIEASLQALLTEELSFSGGFSYTDSEFKNALIESFAGFPSYAPDGDVSGNKILRQSKWQANASATYRTSISNDFEWYTRGDVIYTGKQFIGAPNQGIVPSRTVLNLRTGFESDMYTFELWGENLTNNGRATGAFRDVFFSNTTDGSISNFNTFFPWRTSVSYPRLMTFGATMRVRF